MKQIIHNNKIINDRTRQLLSRIKEKDIPFYEIVNGTPKFKKRFSRAFRYGSK